MYKDTTTGEIYTLEELRDAYADVSADLCERGIESFESYLEDAMRRDMLQEISVSYILIEKARGDEFETLLAAETRDEAEAEAKRFWDRMSEYDQSHTEEFFVAECEEIPGFDWEDWTGEDIDGFPVVLVGESGYKMHDTFAELKRSMV